MRTNVYDYYDLLPYGEYPELYEPYGISEEEYNMMRVYNYTVLGDLPKEFFPEYIEACKAMEKEQGIDFVSKSVDAVKIFVKDVLRNAYGNANSLLFIAAVTLLVITILSKRYALAIYLGIQSAVVCGVWLYFTYWGRAIERIQVTMSLIFLAIILHVLCELWISVSIDEKEENKNNYHTKISMILSLITLALIASGEVKTYRYENIEKTYWYNDVQKIKEYCANDPDRLYYMDIATMTELYGKCTIKNTEPEYINYIAMGDWSAYCPHYEEKLVRHGVDNIAESITDENTYVIMLHNYQLQCMKDYLDVEEDWVETIFGANDVPYAVYQFHKN